MYDFKQTQLNEKHQLKHEVTEYNM